MCGCSLAVMAEWGTIISKPNFSGFPETAGNNVEYDGWILQQSRMRTADNALYVSDYVKTPALDNLNGNAELSFYYANSAADKSAKVIITIEGDGTFNNGTKSYSTAEVSNQQFTSSGIIVINNGSSSTKIKFSRDENNFNMTNLIIEGNITVETERPKAPTFTLPEGYYKTAQPLEMNCETEGATIYYTTDGTEPTAESTAYSAPITISETTTVKAVAIKDETASAVTTARYYVMDYLFAEAFTSETDGCKRLASGTSFEWLNKDIGRSAILSFRMSGRNNSNNTLTLGTKASYQSNWTEEELHPAKDEWTTVTRAIALRQDGATFSLRLSSENCNIDDVVLVTPQQVTLDEAATNNSEILAAYDGKTVDVATVRTLRAGIWNTLCLPFNVTRLVLNTTFGEVQETAMTRYSSYANDVMSFTKVGDQDVISAGEPFLLKIKNGYTNPTFYAVTIAATTPGQVSSNGVTFKGIYSRTELDTGGSDLFIGTDNYLYVPGVGSNVMNGLRAYIQRTNASRISLSIDDGETVAVEHVDAATEVPPVVYTLQGQRTTTSKRRGIYVMEGKKVVIK